MAAKRTHADSRTAWLRPRTNKRASHGASTLLILQHSVTLPQVNSPATLPPVLAALATLAGLVSLTGLLVGQLRPVDVALDPGHSRADIGAAGGGLREYQLTFDLAQRCQTRLEASHLTVRLTRNDDQPLTAYTNALDDAQTQVEQQARIAAAGPSRAYVSLH